MRKRGMLKKMFFSYIGLLIPLFCILLLFFYGLSSEFKKMDDRRLELTVNQVMETVEDKYRNMISRSVQIGQSSYVARGAMLKGESHIQEAIQYISEVCAYEEMIADCFVYYGNDRIYSIEGSSSVSTYIQETLSCNEETAQIIRELLDSEDQDMAVAVRENGGSMLLFHMPIDTVVNGRQASVNFCVSMAELAELMTPLLLVENLYVRMDLENGQSVYLSGTGEEGYREIAQEAFPDVSTGSWIIKEVYQKYPRINLHFSWQYDMVYANIMDYQFTAYVVMTLFLILAGAISFKISYSYWQKTRIVAEMVGDVLEEPAGREAKDEWDLIRKAVSGIVTENRNSKTVITQYQRALRQQVSMMILHGTYNNMEQAEQMLELCELDFYEEYYAVCIIYAPKQQEGLLERLLEQEYTEDIHCSGFLGEQTVFELLLQCPNEDKSGEIRNGRAVRLQKLFEEASSKAGALTIVISSIYDKRHMIAYAWMEALEQLQAMSAGTLSGSIFICRQSGGENNEWKALADVQLKEFGEAMEQKDADWAERVLEKTAKGETKPGDNTVYYRRFCLIRYMIQLLQNSESEVHQAIYEDVKRINLGDTASFLDDMRNIVRYYCSREEGTNFDYILQYIRNNYRRNDFSLEEVADEFGLSRTYVSRIFKKKIGMRYIDYLSNLRMEEAKKELLETDLSIQEIAENVGYFDVPGFRKKFKQMYGINASQYRKQYGKAQS